MYPMWFILQCDYSQQQLNFAMPYPTIPLLMGSLDMLELLECIEKSQ
jgi:hypothetical protein